MEPLLKILRDETSSDPLKEFYKETLDFSYATCDLIIKVGPRGVEHHCHRIILASASEFLRNLLKTTANEKLPVLIIPDLSSDVFKYVLCYVYNGEVRVPHELGAKFLDACFLLEIKGLVADQQMEEISIEEDVVIKQEEEEEIIINDENEQIDVKQEEELIINDEDVIFEENNDEKIEEISDDEEEMEESMPDEDEVKHEEDVVKRIMVHIYLNLTKEPVEPLEEVVGNNKLIYKGQKLIRAIHECGFCENPIFIQYSDIDDSWNKNGLIRHLYTHKAEFCPIKRLNLREHIKINKLSKATHFQKIKEHFRSIYNRLNKKPPKDLELVLKQTSLVTQKKFMIKAKHQCGFCDRSFDSFYYNDNKGKFVWKSLALKAHFEIEHNLKIAYLVKPIPGQFELKSEVMKSNCEFRVKQIIKDVYDRLNLKPNNGKLKEVVNRTEIVVRVGKLMGARHTCGFCKKLVPITFSHRQGSDAITWKNGNLKRHLIANHCNNKK